MSIKTSSKFFFLFILLLSKLTFAQGNFQPPFLEKIYAFNCEQSPYNIIYFVEHPNFGIISLYPDSSNSGVMATTGSAWGNFYQQNGELFKFEKNGYIQNRAVWIRGNKLALIFSNGQFRENQKFYQLCGTYSNAAKFIQSGNKIASAYTQFEKTENRMIQNQKTSK